MRLRHLSLLSRHGDDLQHSVHSYDLLVDEVFAAEGSVHCDGGLVLLDSDADVNVLLPGSEIRFPSDDNLADELCENSYGNL